MSRYIDADKVTEAFVKAAKEVGNIGDQIAFRMIINEIPTADVRENEKGKWEEIAESGLSDLRRCSNCGHIEAVGLEIITPKPNYCPFCGADMRCEA